MPATKANSVGARETSNEDATPTPSQLKPGTGDKAHAGAAVLAATIKEVPVEHG